MHVPDGFLDARTALVTAAAAVAGVAIAVRHARRGLPPRQVPLLGLAAAFVFAAQMINFPVAAGTSGHLVGAVLVAVLLGPSAAVVVIAAVLIVQCLMFADGGLTALGANLLNMGVVGGVGGWAVYRLISRTIGGLFGRLLGAGFAAWCGTVAAAVVCAGELATSRTVEWTAVLPAMVGIHMLIGLGEGAITALVLAGIARTRPELLPAGPEVTRLPVAEVVGYGGLIALGLALFASPFASRWPDGLERTAAALGFSGRALTVQAPAPAAGYSLPWIHWDAASTGIAGALGTLLAFALSWLLARVLTAGATRRAATDGPGAR
jgi:cobalt/nickel transport system permease protein